MTSYRPEEGETICPPPTAVRLAADTSVRGRVRSPHMAKLQAASVPIAYGSCAPRAGTDRRTIAVSLNAPLYGVGHNKTERAHYMYIKQVVVASRGWRAQCNQ